MDVTDVYNTHADTISVDDISADVNNRIVLRRLQRNEAIEYIRTDSFESDDDDMNNDILYIQNHHYRNGEDCVDYVPEGADDMGWLGYFIGKNEHLKKLFIRSFTPTPAASVRDVIVPFFRGVCSNKSIQEINFDGVDLLGGEMFTMLGSFFKNNHNLANITIEECDFGDDGARLFALAIGSSTNKSLRKVELVDNNISEEGMVDIITAMIMHPNLNYLDLDGNRLRKNGCVALTTLLQCLANKLQYLDLSRNEINDDGIEALVPVLKSCNSLKNLYLSQNPSITTRGWQSLATILESPNSNLTLLSISQNNVDDEAVAAFANSLENNHTLYTLNMNDNPITAVGWDAFSKTLCNTSSINSTFLSNHTLKYMSSDANEDDIIGPLLDLNCRGNKKEIAIIKILQCHNDFDMLPFFEWEFKVLPLVLSWLERASEFEMPEDFEPNVEGRKLSTIYQFVRGMPVLYVETRLRKELEDIKAGESQIEEEQLLLDQRKRLAKERKMSIMRRLGRQL